MRTIRAQLALFAVFSALACSDAPAAEEIPREAKKGEAAGPEAETDEELDLDAREFPLLVWSAHMLDADYYDPSRVAPKRQLESALDDLGLHTPEFFGRRDGDQLHVTVRSSEETFDVSGVDSMRKAADVLEQVLVFTSSTLSLEGEPLHELEYAAINGFVAPLDAHTVLLTPEENAQLGVKTRGHFAGIGAEIRPDKRRILVVRVLPNSPAERAGLMAGDLVLRIDDQATVNLSATDAQDLLRGTVGSKVVLTVQREGKAVEVEITRGTIRIESVQSARLPDDVGYLRIETFQEDTSEKFTQALALLGAETPLQGVVIDLRGNSGGLLTQATGVLDALVESGELVIVHSAQGREQEVATEGLGLEARVPVIALVDEESASAAEIVAGAIKHLDRGLVVGRASFGKGTVQMLRHATPYGRELALKMTIAEYRVAGDRQINSVGVRPDVRLFPVLLSEFAGVGRYYDLERFARARQRSRTRHLPSAIHDEGADAFAVDSRRIVHFVDGASTAKPADSLAVRAMADHEVRLSQELAKGLKGAEGGRKAMLDALDPLVERLAGAEDAAVVDAIGRWKTNWDAGPQTATLSMEVEMRQSGPTPAGDEINLVVRVTNEGESPAHRVHAITDCDRDEIDGIELLLGRIEPGETAERTLRLAVMPWHTDFVDDMRVDVFTGDSTESLASKSVDFESAGVARPRFAFDHWIVDDPELAKRAPKRPKSRPIPGEAPFSVKGNGDGLLQPGERVLFAYEASNVGEGRSRATQAILRNLSGTQGLLEEGAAELGGLPAGETVRGAFGITVADAPDPQLPLELDFAIGDAELRESVRHKIRLRIHPEGSAFETVKEVWRVGDEPARIYAGAHASSARTAEVAGLTMLKVIGRSGNWLALGPTSDPSRRLWAPADLATSVVGSTNFDPAKVDTMVDPPTVRLDPEPPRSTSADKITIAGVANHARRVRDVVFLVRPGGTGHAEKKVFYLANPSRDDEGATELAFSSEVDLVPGANRVSVVVRDDDLVVRRYDVWVYRK